MFRRHPYPFGRLSHRRRVSREPAWARRRRLDQEAAAHAAFNDTLGELLGLPETTESDPFQQADVEPDATEGKHGDQ